MAQGRCSAVVAMVAVLLVSAVAVAQSASYNVGDGEGWTVPEATTFYADWAANKTFVVGDTLLFVYNNAAHNVLTVTAADYAACTLTSTNKVSTGNDSLTLVAGVNSYVCGIPTHCTRGQKLSVNATAAAAAPGSPLPITPPSPPTSTTPPASDDNAASGNTVALLQVVAAAMVAVLVL